MVINENLSTIIEDNIIQCNIVDNFDECNIFRQKNNLKIVHLNIRSINRNFDNLITSLGEDIFNIDVLVLTETWQVYNVNTYSIEGFDIIYNNSKINQNDGVIVFVRNTFKYEYCYSNIGVLKSIDIIIKDLLGQKIKITSIYKLHLINNEDFNNNLSSYLDLNKSDLNHVLIGDMNLNTLQVTNESIEYLELLSMYGFQPAINGITHPTRTSGTCIDHIFVKHNFINANINSYIIKLPITDHFLVAISMPIDKVKSNEDYTEKYVQKVDIENLRELIATVNWDEVLNDENRNIDEITITFLEKIQYAVMISTVQSKITRKNLKLKPWMTVDLLTSIRIRNKLYKESQKHKGNQTLKEKFLSYRNKINCLIKKLKNKYNRNQIDKTKNDPKKNWFVINKMIGRQNVNNNRIPEMIKKDKTVTRDAAETADLLNEHFANIGYNIGKEIPRHKLDSTIKTNMKTMYLEDVSPQEIYDEITCLNNNKSSGIDGLPIRYLKDIADIVAQPLSRLINLIYRKEKCPVNFKMAKITPIYKNGNKNDPNNYRPISVINILAKIFERILHKKIMNFLKRIDFFFIGEQYGFQQGKSTIDALNSATKEIYNALENNKKCIGLFIDLRKAFDTLQHDLLLQKLYKIGFRGKIYNLLESYLVNRSQSVKIGSIYSGEEIIKCGVPQGSVLGPLLFIIFVNDIFYVNTTAKIVTYADDTLLLYSDKTWKDVEDSVMDDVPKVLDWFTKNGLTVNFEKTKCIYFGCYRDSLPNKKKLKIDYESERTKKIEIEIVKEYKYLGVIIDYSLKWKEHISYVANKLRYLTYAFVKLRDVVSKKNMKIIFHALFNSIANYAIEIWGGASESLTKPIESLRRRIVKIIFKKKKMYSTEKLYKEADLLSTNQGYIVNVLKFTTKKNIITIEDRPKRAGMMNMCKVPMMKTYIGRSSLTYIGPKIFNSLPEELRRDLKVKVKSTEIKKIEKWVKDKGQLASTELMKSFRQF